MTIEFGDAHSPPDRLCPQMARVIRYARGRHTAYADGGDIREGTYLHIRGRDVWIQKIPAGACG